MRIVFLHLCLLLTAFGSVRAKPVVVSANTILADFVRVVGGEDVEAISLLERGGDPHSFEPRPTDNRHLSRADLLVVNGLGFEPWLEKIAKTSGFQGKIVETSAGIRPLHHAEEDDHDAHKEHAHAHNHDHASDVDPHAWHDPRNVRRYVENLRDALIAVAPKDADHFRQRADAYLRELDALHADAKARFAALPVERRRLVTSHDALHYLAEAYGLTIVPVRGLQPDREPSAKQLAAIVRFVREQKVPAVFVESTSTPKLIHLLARDAGVNIVRELYTDSLGAVGTPGDTFLGMFRANVETIVGALK